MRPQRHSLPPERPPNPQWQSFPLKQPSSEEAKKAKETHEAAATKAALHHHRHTLRNPQTPPHTPSPPGSYPSRRVCPCAHTSDPPLPTHTYPHAHTYTTHPRPSLERACTTVGAASMSARMAFMSLFLMMAHICSATPTKVSQTTPACTSAARLSLFLYAHTPLPPSVTPPLASRAPSRSLPTPSHTAVTLPAPQSKVRTTRVTWEVRSVSSH